MPYAAPRGGQAAVTRSAYQQAVGLANVFFGESAKGLVGSTRWYRRRRCSKRAEEEPPTSSPCCTGAPTRRASCGPRRGPEAIRRDREHAGGIRRPELIFDDASIAVHRLWRYPVKPMGGTPVDAVRIDRRGVHADRLWAVRDLDNDITATGRRIPALLGCTAEYRDEPAQAGPGNVPEVLITFLTAPGAAAPTPISTIASPRWQRTRPPGTADARFSAAHEESGHQSASFAPAAAPPAPGRLRTQRGANRWISRTAGRTDGDKLIDTSIFSLREVGHLLPGSPRRQAHQHCRP